MTARSGSLAACAAALAVFGALAACASAGSSVAPAPPRFRDVRSLVLVRAADERKGHPRDPLDGLDETLRARGFATRVVELGRDRPPGHHSLERLFERLESWAAAGGAQRDAPPMRDRAHDVGAIVEQLGVDAIATYHRLERAGALPPPPPTLLGGAPMSMPAPARRPVGAFVLADRAGNIASFAWGDGGTLEDPRAPLNAAEAIELFVAALTGEPEE